MDPSYAAAYRELYERHWWWRARERFLLDRLHREAHGRSDLRILDVGCGDALFFDRLSQFGTVRGVEPDVALLSEGSWRSAIHAGTLETFETAESFDWILMLDVIEHIAEPRVTLERARALAADDARLFVTVPALRALWTRHDDLNRHYRRYDRSGLRTDLTLAGWQILDISYFFHWLAPLKLGIRLKERLFAEDPEIEAVPPSPLNRAAYLLSRAEQRGVSWLGLPFGTSLYALCSPTDEDGDAAP